LTTREGGNADIAGANICHRVPIITMGVWLLGFGFLRRSTSSFHGVVCRLLISPWMAYMKKMQEQFSFFCLINHAIADATAIGFHLLRFSLWCDGKPRSRDTYIAEPYRLITDRLLSRSPQIRT